MKLTQKEFLNWKNQKKTNISPHVWLNLNPCWLSSTYPELTRYTLKKRAFPCPWRWRCSQTMSATSAHATNEFTCAKPKSVVFLGLCYVIICQNIFSNVETTWRTELSPHYSSQLELIRLCFVNSGSGCNPNDGSFNGFHINDANWNTVIVTSHVS